jgi:hypothetical protein
MMYWVLIILLVITVLALVMVRTNQNFDSNCPKEMYASVGKWDVSQCSDETKEKKLFFSPKMYGCPKYFPSDVPLTKCTKLDVDYYTHSKDEKQYLSIEDPSHVLS